MPYRYEKWSDERISEYIRAFDIGFSYCGGRDSKDNSILLKCDVCGNIIRRSIAYLRHYKGVIRETKVFVTYAERFATMRTT